MAGFEDLADNDEEEATASEEDSSSFEELLNNARSVSSEIKDSYFNVGIYGRPKTGKTHFSMSAPAPMFYIDTESGTGPVEYKFGDKKIKLETLNETSDDFQEDHIEAWKRFKEIVNQLVANEDKLETVVVDSATDIWEICRNYAKDEIYGLTPDEKVNQQWDWGEINSRYRNLVQKLLQADFNVIFTARAQEEYAGAGNPTGTYKPKWQKKTGHWLEVICQAQKEEGENGQKQLYSTIEDSRFDGTQTTIMGTRIDEMEWDDLIEVIEESMEANN